MSEHYTRNLTAGLDEKTTATLSGIATATLTTVLAEEGLAQCLAARRQAAAPWPEAPRRPGFHAALCSRARRSGHAGILEFPDLDSRRDRSHAAGCIAVVDAMGITDAGIFGDILCARMKVRGVAALVTDGVVRDVAGVLDTGFAGVVQGRCRAAIRRRPYVCELAGADWLRRGRGVSGRCHRRG